MELHTTPLTTMQILGDLFLCIFNKNAYKQRLEERARIQQEKALAERREYEQQRDIHMLAIKQMIKDGKITLASGVLDPELETRKATNNMMNAQAKLMCAQAEYLQARADRINSRN